MSPRLRFQITLEDDGENADGDRSKWYKKIGLQVGLLGAGGSIAALGHAARISLSLKAPILTSGQRDLTVGLGACFGVAAAGIAAKSVYRLLPSRDELFRMWADPMMRPFLVLEWILVGALLELHLLEDQGHVRSAAVLAVTVVYLLILNVTSLAAGSKLPTHTRIRESAFACALRRIPGPRYRAVEWLNAEPDGHGITYGISRYTTIALSITITASVVSALLAAATFM